ncbi:MAG TPA: hybrid sensor histidine kinase/response regulator [Gemmatimonadaceae bacterium]|nr:hybrid sensor histidine kinase/response regulator [Gemmatimonadaceae bacterium]
MQRLAIRLFLLSSACWWGAGLAFSNLWWLTNSHQLAWIMFCYAWEVPVVGWTGVVLLPILHWRAINGSVRGLSRFPRFVATCAIATSTLGYAIGALQLIAFAHIPYLEAAKVVVQGALLGAILAAAVFLEAERTAREVALSDAARAAAAAEPIRHTLAKKIRYITITIVLGATMPILLFGLTLQQRRLEEARGAALVQALASNPPPGPMPAFGPHTMLYATTETLTPALAGVPVPIGSPRRATIVRIGTLALDASFSGTTGSFASRYDSHRVVAFRRTASGFLVAVSPLADYAHGLVGASTTAGGLCVVALAVAVLLAFAFSRNLVDPLQRLQDATSAMARGERDVATVAAMGNDEITALTRQFDAMAARVHEDEAKLVQSEKLSAVGRVVSGIAHELNNPLAAVLHFAENLLSEEWHSPDDREMLQSVATQARRARAIVRDLLSFVRARTQTEETADIHDVVRHAAQAVAPILAETGASLSVSFDTVSIPLVRIDEVGIEQVLTNLIVNGAQAAGTGGRIDVLVRANGARVRLSVSDTGPGIPNDVMPRIFEPFFTTKGPGKGTGLGLSVSLGIIQQHGGRLTAENLTDGGARLAFDVPVHPDQIVAAAEIREREAHINGCAAGPRADGETVMVIDDEESIRAALRLFLERSGWRVEEAESGRAALAMLLTAPPNRYRAVITDLTMPDVTGIQLHDTLAAARPDLCARLIISTGETISDAVVSFRARSGKPFLEKPFEFEALTALLEQMP